MARLLPIFVVLVSLLLLAHAANKCHRLVNGRKSIETCRGGRAKWGCYTLLAKGKKSKGCVPIHGRRGKRGGGFVVETNCPKVNGVPNCDVTVDNGNTEVEIKPSEVEESGGMDFDLPSDIGDLPTLPDGDLPELTDIDIDMGDMGDFDVGGDAGTDSAADLLDEIKSGRRRTKKPQKPTKGPGPGPAEQPAKPGMPRSFALGCSRVKGVKICTCAKNLCNKDQVSHTLAAPAAIVMVLLSGVL